jgi:hypothetical protein
MPLVIGYGTKGRRVDARRLSQHNQTDGLLRGVETDSDSALPVQVLRY